MKLHLFALRNAQTKKLDTTAFYASKPKAKKARDKANDEAGIKNLYVVTPGPDHRKFKH